MYISTPSLGIETCESFLMIVMGITHETWLIMTPSKTNAKITGITSMMVSTIRGGQELGVNLKIKVNIRA
jgi:hypothetical protein